MRVEGNLLRSGLGYGSLVKRVAIIGGGSPIGFLKR